MTATTTVSIPCEVTGCMTEATRIESRVDAIRDHRYVCSRHESGGVWEPSPLHSRNMSAIATITMFPPKHRSATKAAAKRLIEAARKTICGAFVCDRTDNVIEYEFADGAKQVYCPDHVAAAVMNGGRQTGIVVTEVDLNIVARARAAARRAEQLLDDYATLVANNAAMKARLDERQARGQKVDRSVLEAGFTKAAEDRDMIRALLRSI